MLIQEFWQKLLKKNKKKHPKWIEDEMSDNQ